jgi:hypothetical protein
MSPRACRGVSVVSPFPIALSFTHPIHVKAKPLGAARRNAAGGPSGRAERARASAKQVLSYAHPVKELPLLLSISDNPSRTFITRQILPRLVGPRAVPTSDVGVNRTTAELSYPNAWRHRRPCLWIDVPTCGRNSPTLPPPYACHRCLVERASRPFVAPAPTPA